MDDAANRLTQIQAPDGNRTYTWDQRGNLTHTGAFTTTYNAAGRMVRAESVDLTSVYTYTADGFRVQQAVDGTVTSFAWDWALPLAQVMATSDGVLSLYGLGYLGETQSGDWAYPLVDALDSVRQWSDGAGAITYAAGYTPFGEALWHAGSTASSWGYAGEWYDPHAELLYLRARWYAVHTGRFTTQDPWGGNHQQPGTLNPYVYALNNPVLLTDPSGERCIAGFDVGPGRGCTDQERQQWAGVWERAGGLVSSPDFAEGFLLEFLDSVLAGGISLPATAIEYWLNRTQNYPVQQFLYSLMMLRCGNNAESYAALKTPYSYLFNRPDPRFQLGRAVGRVTALGLALGEISISVSGGVASAVAAGTGVGVPFAVGGATLSIEVGAHAVAVIGAVVVKEAADHLVLSAVTGNPPGASGGDLDDLDGETGLSEGLTETPINSRGEPYPRIVDPRTGEPMPFPEVHSRVPRESRVSWTTKDKGEFIAEWYTRGYATPDGGWERYEIHHILPREFGGTNDFWNLVPVIKEDHWRIVTPWWSAYP